MHKKAFTIQEVLVVLAIICILLLILIPVFDLFTVVEIPTGNGTIIEKTYIPSRTESYVTIHTDSDGRITPVYSETYHAERWIVVVGCTTDTFSIECDSGTWGRFNKGEQCAVYVKQGRLMKHGYRIGPPLKAER